MSKVNLEILEKLLERDVLKKSFYEFFKWSFGILLPNDRYEDNFHIKYLCDILQSEVERIEKRERKDKDLIINIPPRTSKTLICSVVFPAWVWTRMPSATFLTISFDETLSLKSAQDSRDLIESDKYREYFGHIFKLRSDANAKSYYFNNKGGSRLSRSTGQNVTGFGALFIIVDDPQNPKLAESEIERENSVNYYDHSLFNRLTPIQLGTRMLVMQRLHQKDLTGHLLEGNSKKNYHHICLPARDTEDVKPAALKVKYKNGLLDPTRLGERELDELSTTLGTRGFAGQYLQTPAEAEGSIFKSKWFKIIQPGEVSRDPYFHPMNFAADTAYTTKQENDFSAFGGCFVKDNIIYISDIRDAKLEFPDLCNYVITYTQNNGYTPYSNIKIEPKASGKSVVQTLQKETKLNVSESVPPDQDKIVRAYAITPVFESGRIVFIDGPWLDNFTTQLKNFPKAENDDMVDVLIIMVNEFLLGPQAFVTA